MDIHIIQELPSRIEGHQDVIDDLLERQYAKFIISEDEREKLIVFPYWVKHVEIVRNSIGTLEIDKFHGGGHMKVLRKEMPIDPGYISLDFISPTLEEAFGHDRPKDIDLENKLIIEARSLLANVLSSIEKRRRENDEWYERRKLRDAR